MALTTALAIALPTLRCVLCSEYLFLYSPALLFPIGSHHWVCTAYVPGAAVLFMDSVALFGSGPNQSTTLKLSKLYAQTVWSSRSILNIESLSEQQQSGHLDCGVFAIANAVEVCLGTNPEKVQYKQDAMRAHLEECTLEFSVRSHRALHVQRCCHDPVVLSTKSNYIAFVECQRNMTRWSAVIPVIAGFTLPVLCHLPHLLMCGSATCAGREKPDWIVFVFEVPLCSVYVLNLSQ